MSARYWIAGSMLAAVSAAPAVAQWESFIPDVIASTIMNMNAANAQAMCMTGAAMSDKKVAEARVPAIQAMQAYFDAAQKGGKRSAQFKLNKKTRWASSAGNADMAGIDSISDPLAVAANRLDPDPLRFFRSGGGGSALGQWAVFDGRGEIAGVYTGVFERDQGLWKIHELTISLASETLAPAAQYCAVPGDVTTFRVTATDNWATGARQRLDKAMAKLADADAAAKSAQAAAEEKPRDSTRSMAAHDARAQLAQRTKERDARQRDLKDALEAQAKAHQNADDIKALTGEARLALRFRGPPEGTSASAPAAK